MSLTVAVLGCGVMGGAIARRLLATGCAVAAWDRNPPKVAALAAAGARAAAGPADAASGAGVVLLSLNDAAGVRAVALGPGGAAEGAAPGTLVIDMSSIDPPATRAIAAEAAGRALRWVDAPLSGGAPKAATGTLTLMLGGADADVAEARAVLDRLAARATHLGPVGAGQTVKLINQALVALGFLAVAEATKLAEAAGVDPRAIPAALAGGRADSALLQEFMGKMADRDYAPAGVLANMVKDVDGALALARAGGAPAPMLALAGEIHRLMAAAGWGRADNAALMAFYDGPAPPEENA